MNSLRYFCSPRTTTELLEQTTIIGETEILKQTTIIGETEHWKQTKLEKPNFGKTYRKRIPTQ